MTKSTKATKNAPTSTASFEIGNRVIATTAATNQTPAAGTITNKSSTGWLIVTLDSPDQFSGCKGGILSARASSLKLEANEAGKLVAPATPAPVAAADKKETKKEPKAARKIPDECPECGSGELESDEEGEKEESKMAGALRKARAHYTKDVRPDGSATAHNGDLIAKELRWYEPLEVCELADRCLLCAPGYHADRYADLNPGQKRMNSGNRIRAAYRKATEDNDSVVLARINKALQLAILPDNE